MLMKTTGGLKLKDKACLFCGEAIIYEEWKNYVINPKDYFWSKKKFCSPFCCQSYNNKKNMEKRDAKYNGGLK